MTDFLMVFGAWKLIEGIVAWIAGRARIRRIVVPIGHSVQLKGVRPETVNVSFTP